jgi:hypothetical protein
MVVFLISVVAVAGVGTGACTGTCRVPVPQC